MMPAHGSPSVTVPALRWNIAAMQRELSQGIPAGLT
jgi:hypothetical protein